MIILITILILFITASALSIIRAVQPGYRFSWLVAAGGALIAWLSIGLWRISLPLTLSIPWEPEILFAYSPNLVADELSWAYAFALMTLALAVVLTSVVRTNVPLPTAWAGTLFLALFGLLAVLSENPLTLVLAWSAIDLIELLYLLGSVYEPKASENAVIAFSTRLIGTGIILWASVSSLSAGVPLDFESVPQQAGIYMLIGAGLRLGVLPLHLPYMTELALRRGFGTTLRLISAASSLVLLARIPTSGVVSPLTPYLLILTIIAGMFGAWMWFRADDDLDGRPYWLIGMAALGVAAALRGNPTGSATWGIALMVSGGLTFLYSVQGKRLRWLVALAGFGLTSLPFSLTAVGWEFRTPFSWLSTLPFLPVHALLLIGYIRFAFRTPETTLDQFPRWAQLFYPLGLGLLAGVNVLLGAWGWEGAGQIGTWWSAAVVVALVGLLLWLRSRGLFSDFRRSPRNPLISQRLPFNFNRFYGWLWSVYRFLRQLTSLIATTLEGDGGILWAILLLAIFTAILRGIQ